MKPNFNKGKGAASLPPRGRKPTNQKFPRRGAAGGAGQQSAVELTRVQLLEAKAAREAVLAAAPKSSPVAVKKFVEAISLDVDVDAARQLLLPSKGLLALPPSIGVLCQQLRKLDLSGNDLSDLAPLASLQHLSNLNVSRNPRLASLKGLSGSCLSVLNISFCAVDSLVGLEHTTLTLRTLIANDNRLQFQSPIFRTDGVALPALAGEAEAAAAGQSPVNALLADMAEASPHVPASLRTAVPTSATAITNYILFAACQQCETVVLSRNTQLVRGFPAWSAEELAEACGDTTRRTAQDSGEDSGDDASSSEGGSGAARTRRGTTSAEKAEVDHAVQPAEAEESNKQLKHAMALAHPLSVFERLPRLKKLSLSGCELRSLPSRWFLPMVTELRLAQNHLTSLQPDGVILRSLHILDISNNLFMSVITLRRCRFLEQLNVRGNPLVDEGAVHDKAAGLCLSLPEANATTVEGEVPTQNPAAVPISVQQRVSRLFPSLKLLDNQPVLSAEELRAAYKRGRDAAAAAEEAANAPLHQEETDVEAEQRSEDVTATSSVDDATPKEESELSKKASVTVDGVTAVNQKKAGKVAAPPRKAGRVDPAAIAAEAEEKDVVVEAPASVLKTPHVSIVRRERVLLRPGATAASAQSIHSNSNAKTKGGEAKKKQKGGGAPAAPAAPTVFGQAAVNKLLEQNLKTNAW